MKSGINKMKCGIWLSPSFLRSLHSVDCREKVQPSFFPLLSSVRGWAPVKVLDTGVCCSGCQGKIKSFSWGIGKGERGDGGPLSCSSAGCISPTLYNCVKGALPVAPSLLTSMASPWQPDTPCPLAFSPSLSLFSRCPSAPSPPLPPLGNPTHCYFDPVPPSAHIAFSFHWIFLTSSFIRLGPIVQHLLWLMSPTLWS